MATLGTPQNDYNVHSPSRNKENYSPSTADSPYTNKHKARKVEKPAPLSPMSSLKQAMAVASVPSANPGKDLDSILRKNRSLEEDRISLQQRIGELEEQVQSQKFQVEKKAWEQEQTIKNLSEKNKELQITIERLQGQVQETKEGDESHNRRLKTLRKEKAGLQTENDSLTKNLERMEQYLNAANDVSNKLQNDKQQLVAEKAQLGVEHLNLSQMNQTLATQNQILGTEVEAVKASHLISEGQLKVARDAWLISEKQKEDLQTELQLTEQLMFHALALALKMDKAFQGYTVNFYVHELFTTAIEKKVPKSQWAVFIRDYLEAEFCGTPPQSIPIANSKTPLLQNPALPPFKAKRNPVLGSDPFASIN